MNDIEQLILDLKESLEREIRQVKESLEREIHQVKATVEQGFAQVNARFDTQAARLERHAGMWQTGRRWSARMDAWAEKVDGALEAKDVEIADLRQRLNKLEGRSG